MSRREPKPVAALELRDATRSWPGRPPVFAGLNLTVPGDAVTVLLGPSGCGKSTLLRCAASLDALDSGEVLVQGRRASAPSADRQLIFQDDMQLLPWLTAAENIAFPAKVMEGRSPNPESLLALVGLPDAGGLYPAQLSGGMRQRVVLARALAAGPRILLLDEPFAALDAAIRSRLQVLLLTLRKRAGAAMLLVTHDVTEALVLADRIVFMDASGNLAEPEANPLGPDRQIGRAHV